MKWFFSPINRFSHIKNKGLPFYRLNVYCCIYLSSRVNIFLVILLRSQCKIMFFSRSFVKWQLRENGICSSCWLGNHGKETWLLHWWNKKDKEWSTLYGTPVATNARYMAFIPCSYTERDRSYQEFTRHSTFCAMWCQITRNDFNSCVKLTSQTIFLSSRWWTFLPIKFNITVQCHSIVVRIIIYLLKINFACVINSKWGCNNVCRITWGVIWIFQNSGRKFCMRSSI